MGHHDGQSICVLEMNSLSQENVVPDVCIKASPHQLMQMISLSVAAFLSITIISNQLGYQTD